MINYAEALKIIRDHAVHNPISDIEEVELDDSLDRIVAQDILSEVAVPPYANSAMDGFAVRSAETLGASVDSPLRMRVLGSIVAGDVPPISAPEKGVWEIMTGGPYPSGFDASVKIEDVKITARNSQGQPTEIEISQELSFEENSRDAGEDFQPGQVILQKGQLVQPEHLMALSSVSKSQVPVMRKPRIAILATGKELATLEDNLKPGQIRNSTRHFLVASIKKWGATPHYYGIAGDDPTEFLSKVKAILATKPDVIITTGAVSMGKHDFVKSALADLGAETVFHKTSIRPGKPILFARFPSGPVVFGLPGNPVATVVGWRFFVEPYLRGLLGVAAEKPLRTRLLGAVEKPEDLRCFFKAKLSPDHQTVEVLNGQMSFMVSPLLSSDVWAVLPEGATSENQLIDVYPLASHLDSVLPPSDHQHEKGCC